jgi:hypothetical protein
LYIVCNAVLLEIFCPFATTVAPKAKRSTLGSKVEKCEHQRIPNDGLTTGSVDKQHRWSVASDAQLEFWTVLRTDSGRTDHNRILSGFIDRDQAPTV